MRIKLYQHITYSFLSIERAFVEIRNSPEIRYLRASLHKVIQLLALLGTQCRVKLFGERQHQMGHFR